MHSRLLMAATLAGLLAGSVAAQDVISAKAGFVNYKHGGVTLPREKDGIPVRQLSRGQSVSTGHGRVELLLTPGSFLRLDHESEARMLSTDLRDVQVELLSGAATVEVNEILKGSTIAVVWADRSIPIQNVGLYRFEVNPDSLRVYVEKGKIRLAATQDWLKSKRFADLNPAGTLLAGGKYDPRDVDEFGRWNRSRGEQLALASYWAANTMRQRGMVFRGSLWALDRTFGFYTYLPYSWHVTSPFGYRYYSPRPEPSYSPGSDRGMNAGGWSSQGSSGGYTGSSSSSGSWSNSPSSSSGSSAPSSGSGAGSGSSGGGGWSSRPSGGKPEQP